MPASSVPHLPPPPRRGETPARSGREVPRRGTGPARTAALALAVLMLLALGAPWYEITARAPTASGGRSALHQSLSGWQALSVPAIACALLALFTLGRMIAARAADPERLGADARGRARDRLDGRLLAAGAGLCALIVLIGLGLHPGPVPSPAPATAALSVRWGAVLGLLLALGLAATGTMIARGTGAPSSPRGALSRPRAAARRRTAPSRSRPRGSRSG